MADLDRFKSINDTYGHLAGDAILREAARRLKTAAARYDAVGRYGGEEFLVVLPGCSLPDAWRQAERLREAISDSPFPIEGGGLHVTCSFGLASTGTTCAGPVGAGRRRGAISGQGARPELGGSPDGNSPW